MSINYETAQAIVEATHAAWNAGSLDGVLDKYVDDLVYTSNGEGENGGPLTIYGKEAFRNRFAPVLAAVESKTAIEGFHFQDGIARYQLREGPSAPLTEDRPGAIIQASQCPVWNALRT